jgi:hypothetical protein
MKTLSGILLCIILLQTSPAMAATIVINNADGPNEGFNAIDQPNANQVGDNPGSNRGEMRMNVFVAAANVWASLLHSNAVITVSATFDPKPCTVDGGTLGSARATSSWANFAGGTPETAYHVALAEALFGADLNGSTAEISTTFSSTVDDDPNCLTGMGFYYGLDGNAPDGLTDLYPVVLHELGHGLGFSTISDVAPGGSGDFVGAGGYPDAFSKNLRDLEAGNTWDNLSSNQRLASALNDPDLVWDGPGVTADRVNWLGPAPELVINAPAGIAGIYPAVLGVEPSIIMPANGATGAVTNGDLLTDECTFFSGSQAGRIVLHEYDPACGASVRAYYAEAANNALGVVVSNTAETGLPDMGPQIGNQEVTIPHIGVTKAAGDAIRANIASANVTIRNSPTTLSGENTGKVRMYAPADYESGSSVSHFTSAASPDLLMEPRLGRLPLNQVDLTLAAFYDMGWLPNGTGNIIWQNGFEKTQ